MAFIKNKMKKFRNKTNSIKQIQKLNDNMARERRNSMKSFLFCNREIHDPLFNCCCGFNHHSDFLTDYEDDEDDDGYVGDVINYNRRFEILTNNVKNKKEKFNKIKKIENCGSIEGVEVEVDGNCDININKVNKIKLPSRVNSRPTSRLTSRITPDVCVFDLKLNDKLNTDNKSSKKWYNSRSKYKKQLQQQPNATILSSSRQSLNQQQRSFEKDCEIIKSERLNTYRNLCDQFENTYITPKITKIYQQIPEHDKRILNRMAMKRTKEIALIQDSLIARRYWDNEKSYRNHITNEQHDKYLDLIRDKRLRENKETEQRLAYINDKQRLYKQQLKMEIDKKNLRLDNRLKTIEYKRELDQCERRQDEYRKLDTIAMHNEELEIEKAIRRQSIFERLEQRIKHADKLRQRMINSYKSRLEINNEIAKCSHTINLDEIKRIDDWRLNKLKEEIQYRDKKYNKFIEKKNRIVEESRMQARQTADLRELVRRSISPDNISFRVQLPSNRMLNERSLSNMSNISHVKLG